MRRTVWLSLFTSFRLAALVSSFCFPTTAFSWISLSRGKLHHKKTFLIRFSQLDSLQFSNAGSATTSSKARRDALLRQVLTEARKLGPIGANQPEEKQLRLLDLARQLGQYSDSNPARIPLTGTHSLVYSSSRGFSSGRLFGPLSGTVNQEFLDAVTFRNRVEIGPVRLSLEARRVVKSSTDIQVSFLRTGVSLFGHTLIESDAKGQGVWRYVFAGIHDEDGQKKLIRIFEAPSLFVLEQLLPR